jgi:hypothetical protein
MSKSTVFVLIATFTIAVIIAGGDCEPSDILRTCYQDGDCGDDSPIKFNSPQFRDNMFEYVSSGTPRIFWNFVAESLNTINITQSCTKSLRTVSKGLDDGEDFAFESKLISV